MKVITFSRVFPSYHPRAGEQTGFIHKIWKSIGRPHSNFVYPELHTQWINYDGVAESIAPKHHTIRAGHRWKAGDYFSPRVWSGKPYNSKQIQFAPDIKIKKVWDFQIIRERDGILTWYSMTLNGKIFHSQFHTAAEIWTNDGLTYNEFCDWFKMDSAKKDLHFDGQVICWSDSIEY
jgi:hypothetical protein